MKKLIYSLAIISSLSFVAFAQNPYASIGKKTKPMLSLSNGKYAEHFENDSIRQIGSVMINMRTEQIVAFVNRKEQAKKNHSKTSSRFLSVDPLARQFPFLTPYQYASNTPIQAIDLDGLEKIYYLGAFAKTGKSTIINLLNQTKIYKNAVNTFQDVTKNNGSDLIVIEGVTGSSNGLTFGLNNQELKNALASDDKVEAIHNATGGSVSKESISDQFMDVVATTAESGNYLIFNVISKNQVDDAEKKDVVSKSLTKKSVAMTVGHEFVAHALEDAIIGGAQSSPENQNAQHKKFFGSRNNKGDLIKGGVDCQCDGTSPPLGSENPTSTGGKLYKQIDKAISNEKPKE